MFLINVFCCMCGESEPEYSVKVALFVKHPKDDSPGPHGHICRDCDEKKVKRKKPRAYNALAHLASMRKYIRLFEKGEANPDGITVKFCLTGTNSKGKNVTKTFTKPFRLTDSGYMADYDDPRKS